MFKVSATFHFSTKTFSPLQKAYPILLEKFFMLNPPHYNNYNYFQNIYCKLGLR